jgi:pSer/pThr/pTyr-binding forkhead associated (FHA) protein
MDEFLADCGTSRPLDLRLFRPGRAVGEQHLFEQAFALVGRQERCCLRLEDPAVSHRHAYFQVVAGRLFAVDLGSRTGTRWEGVARPSGWVEPGQDVEVGPFTLRAAPHGPDEPGAAWGPAAGRAWDPLELRTDELGLLPPVTVEVCSGKAPLSRWRMNRLLALVGRAPGCRICLVHPSVSRFHCSLLATPAGVWVVDLLSTKGTLLNGQPVRWARVADGDRLQVGRCELRFVYARRPGRAAAPRAACAGCGGPPVRAATRASARPRPARLRGRRARGRSPASRARSRAATRCSPW